MHIVTFLAGLVFAAALVALGPELATKIVAIAIIIAIIIVAVRSE